MLEWFGTQRTAVFSPPKYWWHLSHHPYLQVCLVPPITCCFQGFWKHTSLLFYSRLHQICLPACRTDVAHKYICVNQVYASFPHNLLKPKFCPTLLLSVQSYSLIFILWKRSRRGTVLFSKTYWLWLLFPSLGFLWIWVIVLFQDWKKKSKKQRKSAHNAGFSPSLIVFNNLGKYSRYYLLSANGSYIKDKGKRKL